ncbi:alanine or glycine:cation symporter, AGCS family [Modicisalibacter ilicicola DSM 19980]|uniref:Alanine or glycine:cation symporter, AGCS family n=1 Tax=Modicisalibacter ilicicola DSM 19980 TaxID=1121942 RepID=A0A1M4TJS0_9GAMM|nr:alanine/glycine:cation symporter family protein [Halomonas ilicicola]SHE44635.1 alanine or glycine:cation symporter, AGCS family [Halomonas ilicicola DSM 19980]
MVDRIRWPGGLCRSRWIIALLLLGETALVQAAPLEQGVETLFGPVSSVVSSVIFFSLPVLGVQLPIVVLWLAFAAVFTTLYFNFINLRGFGHALKLLRGDYSHPDDEGEVSHFQALATAVSGTVGIGNIGGVAFAVSLGGPGVVFWMVVAGFLAMSLKFVECTLATYYRRYNTDRSVSGGPMFYLRQGLGEHGFPALGRFLGAFYAIGVIVGCLGIGNMFQSQQAVIQLVNVTGGAENSWFADRSWLLGVIMAGMIGLVILGGIKTIARVTEKVVPFMAILYCLMALLVIAMNADALPYAVTAIFRGAFTAEGAAGGALGACIIGFQRAVFSNEAGLGSAAIAHSAVRTLHPVTEGFVALVEPFVDTVVICTLTGLVIVTTLFYDPAFTAGLGGIEMTSDAFARNVSWLPIPLAVAAWLFAFSTALAWSYYGLKGWCYLFGESRWGGNLFKLLFCLFTVIGSMVQLESLISFSDALIFLIGVPNVVGIYVLAPIVKRELRYYRVMLRSGEVVNYREQKELLR